MKYSSDVEIKKGDFITLKDYSKEYSHMIPEEYWNELIYQKLYVVEVVKYPGTNICDVVKAVDEEDIFLGVNVPWCFKPVAIKEVLKEEE